MVSGMDHFCRSCDHYGGVGMEPRREGEVGSGAEGRARSQNHETCALRLGSTDSHRTEIVFTE
jgi:hypothetical protein